jgi:hypothetical protein
MRETFCELNDDQEDYTELDAIIGLNKTYFLVPRKTTPCQSRTIRNGETL